MIASSVRTTLTDLGIEDDERAALASEYAIGTELWRLRAQAGDDQCGRQAEPRADTELAIHRQISSPPRLAYGAGHRTYEGDLAEARPDLRRAGVAQLERATIMLVYRWPWPHRLPREACGHIR